MADLSTKYLGFHLNSPLIVSSSPLTEEIDNLKRMEAYGAAAVVLPSLFQEQIELEEMGYSSYYKTRPASLPPELQHVPSMEEYNEGAGGYLAHIHRSKRAVQIPIIASLNGYFRSGWTRYARLIEAAGADALELNVYQMSIEPKVNGQEIEQMMFDLVRDVTAAVNIPVAVKLSPYYSAMANIAWRLDQAGVGALVLFNRFYQPDIEVVSQTIVPSLEFSTSSELRLRLRWVALLAGQLQADFAITGGVHTAADVVKCVLAGAAATMMTSALYRHGIEHLATVKEGLEKWLDEQELSAFADIRGRLCRFTTQDSTALERANYMRVLKSELDDTTH